MTLDELKAIHAKVADGCDCRFDCECGYVKAETAYTIELHNAFPAIVERLERAEELLRLFAGHRDCHEIRAFLAESGKPLEAK